MNNNSTWTKIWNAIPKYICWGIWLARNEAIFNNKRQSTNIVAAKAKALMLENFENRPHKLDNSLLPAELRWLGESLRRASIKKNTFLSRHNPEQRLWISEAKFKNGGKLGQSNGFLRWSLQKKPGDIRGRRNNLLHIWTKTIQLQLGPRSEHQQPSRDPRTAQSVLVGSKEQRGKPSNLQGF